MKRVRNLLAEYGAVLTLVLLAAAAVVVFVRMEAKSIAYAEARADDLCAHNNWTKVGAQPIREGGYYVVALRSDGREPVERRVYVFPGDPQADNLLGLSDGARFAFERTESQDFRARKMSSNYVAVRPLG